MDLVGLVEERLKTAYPTKTGRFFKRYLESPIRYQKWGKRGPNSDPLFLAYEKGQTYVVKKLANLSISLTLISIPSFVCHRQIPTGDQLQRCQRSTENEGILLANLLG